MPVDVRVPRPPTLERPVQHAADEVGPLPDLLPRQRLDHVLEQPHSHRLVRVQRKLEAEQHHPRRAGRVVLLAALVVPCDLASRRVGARLVAGAADDTGQLDQRGDVVSVERVAHEPPDLPLVGHRVGLAKLERLVARNRLAQSLRRCQLFEFAQTDPLRVGCNRLVRCLRRCHVCVGPRVRVHRA